MQTLLHLVIIVLKDTCVSKKIIINKGQKEKKQKNVLAQFFPTDKVLSKALQMSSIIEFVMK